MSDALATDRQRVLYSAREIWQEGFVTLDTETTGLDYEDEVIQWAICDQQGNVLGNGYVKPTVPVSAGAFAIHGIGSEQLVDAPTFADAWTVMQPLLTGKMVVIYNANFELDKIWSSARARGLDIAANAIQTTCAMQLFAAFYGEIHEYWGSYTWQTLTTAISSLQIELPGEAHDAAYDATATAMVIRKMAELADQELPAGWHPPVMVKCAGCKEVVKECAEADEIWYCHSCSLACGLFHPCPACHRTVKNPPTGYICDDLCEMCQERLQQEKMVFMGAWHRCPEPKRAYSSTGMRYCGEVVETAELDELCANCHRQREWRRQSEETERARQEKIERERKEHKRAYAKAYREEQKALREENLRLIAQGLPPIEKPKPEPPAEFFEHNRHHFQRRKDQRGEPEVYCSVCESTWKRPPTSWCAGVKVYWSWPAIPEHLKTKTQLLKLKLQPARGQKRSAVMENAFHRYDLYDQNMCVFVEGKRKAKEEIV